MDIFHFVFLGLAIFGLISELLPKEDAFLDTNIILNITHFITAIALALVTKQGENVAIQLVQIFGSTYMLISAIGFIGMNMQVADQWPYLSIYTF